MKTDLKIVIADDHELVRLGIERTIQENEIAEVVGKFSDGKKLLQGLNSIAANFIIIDINMPNLNGIETAEQLLIRFPKIAILVVSQYEDIGLIKKLKKMGVKGHLPKSFDQNQLIEAILTIRNKEDFFPLLDNNNDDKRINRFKLTSRELEIIYLLAMGNTTKDMAVKLELSDYTIDTHRKNITRKTNAKSPLAIINLAKELNLID